jgi:uncharacterized membrane protein
MQTGHPSLLLATDSFVPQRTQVRVVRSANADPFWSISEFKRNSFSIWRID